MRIPEPSPPLVLSVRMPGLLSALGSVLSSRRAGDPSAGTVARALAGELSGFSAVVEPEGADALIIRLERVYGQAAAQRVAQWIAVRLDARFGRRPRIGIGPNVLVARMAARTADGGGIVIFDVARYREAVGGWRVRELPGVTPRVERRLVARGVLTIGQLAVARADDLGLGVAGRVLCERARGVEPRAAIELVPVVGTGAAACALGREAPGVTPGPIGHGSDAIIPAPIGHESAAAIERLVSGTFGARVRAKLLREGRSGEWKVLPIEALRRSA